MRHILLAASLAIVAASATHAFAASTDVIDTANPIYHPYQETESANCTAQGDCAVVFPATTASQTLVTHASCSFFLATGGAVTVAVVGRQTTGPINAVSVFSYATASGGANNAFNADTYLFYDKGQQPRVDVISLNEPVQSLYCTLSGYTH
jgi:hypothetical protein